MTLLAPSRVQRATVPDFPDGDTAASRRLARKLEDASKRLRSASRSDLERYFGTSNIEAIVQTFGWEAIAQTVGEEVEDHLRIELGKAGDPWASRMGFRFDLVNPRVIEWASVHTGELIVEVNAGSMEAVRSIVVRGLQDGLHPREAVPLLRQVVGLHSRYANAVYNLGQKLARQGYSTTAIDRATARYADRLLRARALNIARTETLKAQNMGRYESWRQSADRGLIDARWQKQWVSNAATEHQYCADLDGMTVPVFDSFPEVGEMPPAHPSCVCTAILITPQGERSL